MIIDAGPLIDSERVNTRLFALLKRSTERGEELHTTHPVLSQVWRDPGRQVHIQRALRAFTTHPLDNSKAVGSVLAKSGTSDVVDAHLATVAQALGTFVVTTDPDDMSRLGARFEHY